LAAIALVADVYAVITPAAPTALFDPPVVPEVTAQLLLAMSTSVGILEVGLPPLRVSSLHPFRSLSCFDLAAASLALLLFPFIWWVATAKQSAVAAQAAFHSAFFRRVVLE
jgi:hypothetical protein